MHTAPAGPSRVSFILNSAAFLAFFDRALLPPLITVIAASMVTRDEEIGRALTAYVLAYALAQIPWSLASGRVGRLRVIAAAVFVGAVGNILSAVATDPQMLLIGRVVAGVGFAGTVPTILVYIGDTLALSRRTVAAANLAAALSLGMTVGTAGGAVAGVAGWWRGSFLVVAGLCVVLAVVLLMHAEPAPSVHQPFLPALSRIVRSGWSLGVLALTVLEGALLVGVFSYLPVAVEDAGGSAFVAGLVTAVFGVAVIGWTRLVPVLVRHLKHWQMMLVAGLAIVAGYSLLSLVLTPLTAAIGSAVLAIGWGIGHTQLQTWMTEVVATARPLGMSIFGVALFGGGAIGAALGNVALAHGAFRMLFATAAAAGAVFAVTATIARARYSAKEG